MGKKISAAAVLIFVSNKEGIKCFFVLFPYFRIYTVTNAGTVDSSLDQSGGFQLFQMLGYCCLGKT
jgi:hypothetical protein